MAAEAAKSSNRESLFQRKAGKLFPSLALPVTFESLEVDFVMLGPDHQHSRKGIGPADAVARTGLLAALWWTLNFGDAASWLIGGPAVVAATVLSFVLTPSLNWRLDPVAAVRFLAFFLWHSICGGIDVARRVFDPRLPLQPGLVTHTLRLPAGAMRVFLTNTVSLQPGTLSAELGEHTLTVHALDTAMPVLRNLRALEAHVARMLRVKLAAETGGES